MNRSGLGAQLPAQFSLTRDSADGMAKALSAAVGDSLAKGDAVLIAGFGTFTTTSRPARRGRNPRTRELIAVAASTAPAFEPGKALRDAIDTPPD